MAKQISILTALLWGFLLIAGCGSSHEKVTAEAVRNLEETVDILKTIDSNAAYEEAKGRLKEALSEGRAIKKRLKALGEPSDDVFRQIEERYAERMKRAREQMFKEMTRVRALLAGRDMMSDAD
jgi:hypothetical protein